MLLSEARARVLRHLDDDGSRYNEANDYAEIDFELRSAQQEAWQLAISAAPQAFQVEGTATASAGAVSLTSLAPQVITSVVIYDGGARLKVPQVLFQTAPQNYTGSHSLRITYVPRVSFPASAGAAFTWGSRTTGGDMLDALTCALAAQALIVRSAKPNPQLDARIERLERSVRETLSPSAWSVLPLDAYAVAPMDSGLGYILTGEDALRLVVP